METCKRNSPVYTKVSEEGEAVLQTSEKTFSCGLWKDHSEEGSSPGGL